MNNHLSEAYVVNNADYWLVTPTRIQACSNLNGLLVNYLILNCFRYTIIKLSVSFMILSSWAFGKQSILCNHSGKTGNETKFLVFKTINKQILLMKIGVNLGPWENTLVDPLDRLVAEVLPRLVTHFRPQINKSNRVRLSLLILR